MMMIRYLCLCLIAFFSGPWATAQAATQPGTEDRFEVRNVEGWTVYINRDVPREYPQQTARTLEHLRWLTLNYRLD